MTRLEEDLKTRGTGRTTRQMKAAAPGAIYIWCNERTAIAKPIAVTADRADLRIVGPSWLDGRRWMGLELTGIAVDHAARLTHDQMESLWDAKTRIRHAPEN